MKSWPRHLPIFDSFARTGRDDSGFSLIEALVALTIVSIAGVAMLRVQGESSRAIVALEDHFLAEIAAENMLVRELLKPSGNIGSKSSRKIVVGNREYLGSAEWSATADGRYRKLEIAIVQNGGDQIIYTLSHFEGAIDDP